MGKTWQEALDHKPSQVQLVPLSLSKWCLRHFQAPCQDAVMFFFWGFVSTALLKGARCGRPQTPHPACTWPFNVPLQPSHFNPKSVVLTIAHLPSSLHLSIPLFSVSLSLHLILIPLLVCPKLSDFLFLFYVTFILPAGYFCSSFSFISPSVPLYLHPSLLPSLSIPLSHNLSPPSLNPSHPPSLSPILPSTPLSLRPSFLHSRSRYSAASWS